MRWRLRGSWSRGLTMAVIVASAATQFAVPAGAATPSVAWGTPVALSGATTVTVGTPSQVSPVISCSSVGNCVAVGSYRNNLQQTRAFVESEVAGVWGAAATPTGVLSTATTSSLVGASCSTDGNCVTVGTANSTAVIEESVGGVWQHAFAVPGLSAFGTGTSSLVQVACSTPGNCTATGTWQSAKAVTYTITTTETSGTWSAAQLMLGSKALGIKYKGTYSDAEPNALSCSSTGNCVVGGFVSNALGYLVVGFLYQQVGGVWTPALVVPGLAALNAGAFGFVNAVSCSTATDCEAGGTVSDANQVQSSFLVTEVGGVWGNARTVPGESALNVGTGATSNFYSGGQVVNLSCASPGNCTAVGEYTDDADLAQIYTTTETAGVWSTATPLPNYNSINVSDTGGSASLSNLLSPTTTQLSCSGPGTCTVAGSYSDVNGNTQFFTAIQSGGTFANATPLVDDTGLPTDVPNGNAQSLWCDAGGNCVFSGELMTGSSLLAGVFATSSAGTWSTAAEFSTSATLSMGTVAIAARVACPKANSCVSAGMYYTAQGNESVFVDQQTAGAWGIDTALPGVNSLNAQNFQVVGLSCPSLGNCGLVGVYSDETGNTNSFYDSEISGVWQSVAPVTGITVFNPTSLFGPGVGLDVAALSCPTAGNCVAVGDYQFSSFATAAFVLTDASGVWSATTSIGTLDSLNFGSDALSSLVCTAASKCVAGGTYADVKLHPQSLLATDVGGTWTTAAVPGSVTLNAAVRATDSVGVSTMACAKTGSCVLAGNFEATGRKPSSYIAIETGGVWGPATVVTGTSAFTQGVTNGSVASVTETSSTCPSAGNCTLTGIVDVVARNNTTQRLFGVRVVSGVAGPATVIVTPTAPSTSGFQSFVPVGVGCLTKTTCVDVVSMIQFTLSITNGVPKLSAVEDVLDASVVNGQWSATSVLPMGTASAEAMGLSCAPSTGCLVSGDQISSKGASPVMVTAA